MDDLPRSVLARRVVMSLLLIAAVLALGVGLFKFFEGLRAPPRRAGGAAPLPVVRAEVVRRGVHREVLRGYGRASALREARVSAQVGGIVKEVSADLRVGAEVVPPPRALSGTHHEVKVPPLVAIDPQDLEDALVRLSAELEQTLATKDEIEAQEKNLEQQIELADRRLKLAQAELERIRPLVPDTLPESDLDRQQLAVFALDQLRAEVVTRRDQAGAQVKVTEARIEALRAAERRGLRDLGRTNVYAPFVGRVTARHVEEGTLVAPGAPLFDLVDVTRVEVAIPLPAGRFGQVLPSEEEDQVELWLRAGGPRIASGPVVRVDPHVDPQTLTFRVYVEVTAASGAAPIAPGAHVIADVHGVRHEDVLPVPREAFLGKHVYVVEPDEEDGVFVAVRRTPRVLHLLPAYALVAPENAKNELADGDRVVVSNLEDIAAGSRIRVVPATADVEAPGP